MSDQEAMVPSLHGPIGPVVLVEEQAIFRSGQPGEARVDLEPPAIEVVPRSSAMPEVVRNDPSPPPQSETAQDEPDGEDAATPTRVPWLKYENKPVRRAPQRIAPEPTDAVDPKERHRPDEAIARKEPSATEPLLTEEELRALIGDDISSIAPSESAPNGIEGPVEERGEL